VLADALRVRISESALPLAERPVARTVSIGVAAWRAGDTPETLMDRADGALYAAKREGRDRVVLA
jgi:diguanylate cyclase (GGDEF)-like protein